MYMGGASSDVDRDDADADVPEAEWSLQTSSPLVAQRWSGGILPPNDPPTICDVRGCWCVCGDEALPVAHSWHALGEADEDEDFAGIGVNHEDRDLVPERLGVTMRSYSSVLASLEIKEATYFAKLGTTGCLRTWMVRILGL